MLPIWNREMSGLSPNQKYRFRVRARNRLGWGPYSAWTDAGSPSAAAILPPQSGQPSAGLVVFIPEIGFSAVPSAGEAPAYNAGTARAVASLREAGSGTLGSMSYLWEGRYLRTQQPSSSVASPSFSVAPATSSWTALTAYTATGGGDFSKAYVISDSAFVGAGSTLSLRRALTGPSSESWPNHFWELRCRVTGEVIVTGASISVEAISRTITFRELWNGIDYPTVMASS